jgi:hypothetical protein
MMAKEQVFFDGGPHWGDLAVNLVFGISVLWLPLTLAAVARGLLARLGPQARVNLLWLDCSLLNVW